MSGRLSNSNTRPRTRKLIKKSNLSQRLARTNPLALVSQTFISAIELIGLLSLGRSSTVNPREIFTVGDKLEILQYLRKSLRANERAAFVLLAFAWACKELNGITYCLQQVLNGDNSSSTRLATKSGLRHIVGGFVLLLEGRVQSGRQRLFVLQDPPKDVGAVADSVKALRVFLNRHGFLEIDWSDFQKLQTMTLGQRPAVVSFQLASLPSSSLGDTNLEARYEFVVSTGKSQTPLVLGPEDPDLTLALSRLLFLSGMFSVEEYSSHFFDLQQTLLIDFPFHQHADAVIVIPHFENHEVLASCLKSLGPEVCSSKYKLKIVIADDASHRSIHDSINLPESVEILEYSSNVGYLRNVNRAVRETTEPIVILLNNDCIVMPGWCDELLSELEKNPGSQIIGSKLFYPDGSIQEAGGAILKDGSVLNLGRGEGDSHPLFSWSREVDYVSGAALAVRREFWNQVEGFDLRYLDAYCEDVDLCLQARQIGGSVRFASESKVVHLESQTYGLVRKINKARRENTAKLAQKWHSTLESEYLAAPIDTLSLVLQGQRSRPKHSRGFQKNVVLFSPFATYPLSHGNRMRTWQIGQNLLDRGHLVHFVLFDQEGTPKHELNHMHSQWTSLTIVGADSRRMTHQDAIPFDGWYQEGLGERVAALVELHKADVVICSYVFQSKILDFIPKYVKKIIDTHDKMSDRYSMFLERHQAPEFFSCSAEDEAKYLARADEVWSLREEESAYFANITSNSVLSRVVPHIEKQAHRPTGISRLQNVGLLASANNINADLVSNLLHSLRDEFGPTLPFSLIIGGEVRDLLQARGITPSFISGLEILGFVENLADFYGRMDCIVSPVEFGTGVNIKTVQALARSVPLVATKFAMKGLDSDSPFHSLDDVNHVSKSLRDILDKPDLLEDVLVAGNKAYSKYIRLYENELFNSVENLAE